MLKRNVAVKRISKRQFLWQNVRSPKLVGHFSWFSRWLIQHFITSHAYPAHSPQILTCLISACTPITMEKVNTCSFQYIFNTKDGLLALTHISWLINTNDRAMKWCVLSRKDTVTVCTPASFPTSNRSPFRSSLGSTTTSAHMAIFSILICIPLHRLARLASGPHLTWSSMFNIHFWTSERPIPGHWNPNFSVEAWTVVVALSPSHLKLLSLNLLPLSTFWTWTSISQFSKWLDLLDPWIGTTASTRGDIAMIQPTGHWFESPTSNVSRHLVSFVRDCCRRTKILYQFSTNLSLTIPSQTNGSPSRGS